MLYFQAFTDPVDDHVLFLLSVKGDEQCDMPADHLFFIIAKQRRAA